MRRELDGLRRFFFLASATTEGLAENDLFYGFVLFSSEMTNVQLCKKVCRFSRISTVRLSFCL
jgi:hypothetical protein